MKATYTTLSDPNLVKDLTTGAFGVLPTDTIYGVVAAAHSQTAVAKLYALKRREKKPGTIIAAKIEQLVELGLKRKYLKVVEKYWPGPITVVVPTDNPTLSYLDQGVGSVAVRIVDDTELINFLEQTGPLATSSANMPGEPPANTAEEAAAYFGDQVDFYVDGGNLHGRKPSTIVRVVDDDIEILRQGSLEINRS